MTTPRERDLLQQVRDRDAFQNPEPGDPTSCEAFDALVRELEGLERRGWITLVKQRNYLTNLGVWYAALPALTREGRAMLDE